MQELLHLTERYGLLLSFAGVLLESLGVPLPAMPLLIVAGALCVQGSLWAPAAFALAVLACLLGDLVWFAAGRRYGQKVLKTLCRISISPDSCVRQTETFFSRWGARTLVVAKFIPGLSTIAPPLAGAMRIGLGPFLVYAALGAALWVGLSIGIGMLFHAQIALVGENLARIGSLALYLLAAAFVAFLAFKWWERQRFFKALRMARISVDELQRLMHGGARPVVLDVRSEASRQRDARRIPGARFVDLQAAETALADVDRSIEVIVYCTCPNEASAARVARVLKERGFQRVRPLAGGLDAWLAAGHGVDHHPPAPAPEA